MQPHGGVQMTRLLFILVLLTGACLAQAGNTVTITASGAPTGSCSYIFQYIDSATGTQYNCKAGAWNAIGGSGSGTTTIASGTAALATSAISSATCATVVTSSGTGIATTDVITVGFNGDPTAVTGYVPLTTGMLTIIVYPTTNTANFKVCNNTSASITPGAITLNWRVVR